LTGTSKTVAQGLRGDQTGAEVAVAHRMRVRRTSVGCPVDRARTVQRVEGLVQGEARGVLDPRGIAHVVETEIEVAIGGPLVNGGRRRIDLIYSTAGVASAPLASRRTIRLT
jgi:hypothetical protein